MPSPSQLLQTIYQADQDTGDFYVRSMLFDVASDAVIAKRDAYIRTVFEGAPHAIDVLRKRLGRSYIESVSKGDPQFEPEAVAAYEDIAKTYEEISKITSGWVVVNGNKIQVYRDARGRFTSRGAAPTEARTTRETAAFYHPSSRTQSNLPPTAVLPNRFEPFLEPGTGPARYRTSGSSEEEDRMVSYGVQARQQGIATTDALREKGVLAIPDDRNRFKVTGSFVSTDGDRVEEELVWQGGNNIQQGAFLPPNGMELGWALEEVYVEPKNPNDTEAFQRIEQAQPKMEFDVGPYAAAAGAAAAPMGLQDKGESTLLGRNVARANMFGGALEAAGMGRTAAAVRAATQVVGRVDQDSDLRRALTQTAYRYRAVEAPTIGRDVRMAASKVSLDANGKAVPKQAEGFDEARMAYYKQRNVVGPMSGNDSAFIKEALEMGSQRDRLSLLLYNKQRARSPDTTMGGLGTTSANYSSLAQKIARGIGRGIPSEGVLIDRHGQPVTQSMGIAHDTFLPFNADALSKLKGGQYVRTRQLGGFTGEDLRTLLVGNGRAAQVVSGSGVYELEIDPAVRGKRRYNDRTLQMIDTYDRILDEVAAGGHYVVPLPANMENEAKAAAEKEIKALKAKGTKVTAQDEKRIENEARADQYDKMAVLNQSDIDELEKLRPGLEAEARERFGSKVRFGGDKQTGARAGQRSYSSGTDYQQQMAANDWVERQMQQIADDREHEKSRMLSLNSEGYAVALATLQQYYPYMIRTARYRSWPEMNAQSTGQPVDAERMPSRSTDRWYTQSGGSLRPAKGEADARFASLGLPVNRELRREQAKGTLAVQASSRYTMTAPTGGVSHHVSDIKRNPEMERSTALRRVAQVGQAQPWISQSSDDPDTNIFSASDYTNYTPSQRGRLFLKAVTANSTQAVPVLLDRANGGQIVEALSDPRTWESLQTGKNDTPDMQRMARQTASSMAEQVLAATTRERLNASNGKVADIEEFNIDDVVRDNSDMVVGKTPAQQAALARDPAATPAKQMADAIRMKNLDPAQATSAVDGYRQLGEQLRGSSVENEPFEVQLEALQQQGVPDDDLSVIKLLQTRMQGAAKVTDIDDPNILMDDNSAAKARALVALGAGLRYSEVVGGGAGPKVQYQVGKRHQRLRKAHDPLLQRDWLLLSKAYSGQEFRSLRKDLLLQDSVRRRMQVRSSSRT